MTMSEDQTQNIQVFVRCRPSRQCERRAPIEVLPIQREIRVSDRNSGNGQETRNFFFDQVFGEDALQQDVYNTVVGPLIDQILQGFSCTVFAYGQTGTGKTYTMEGVTQANPSSSVLDWENDPDCGVIPRAISQLVDTLTADTSEFSLRVSFLELYNEDAYDLLSPTEDMNKLKIFEAKDSTIVGNLKEVSVSCKDEIYDILRQGSAKRQTAATKLNACSSRSHTIFTIIVNIKEGGVVKIGKLNLVDMAGSENIGRSGAQDKRAREAGSINQSLLTLGRVITSLVEKRPHVPYRESKLTRLLKDSLGGKTKTSIIATISPASEDIEDTLSTLDYALRARRIVNRPESNQQVTQKMTLVDYRAEMQHLMEKQAAEICDVEFKVRNEVAVEFKREMEKMKQSFKEQRDRLAEELQKAQASLDSQRLKDKAALEEKDAALEGKDSAIAEKDEVIEKLSNDLRQVQEALELEKREHKVTRELAEYRHTLVTDFEQQLKQTRLELMETQERENLANDKLRKLDQPQDYPKKKASKIRCKTPLAEEGREYANITFDGGDELANVSTKKPRKTTVVGARKRAIDQTITLSGKKRKLTNNDTEAELSPIAKPVNTRVTRSRATRRKLDF